MKFLKRNRYLIVKTLGTQIVMSILGIMLYSAVSDIMPLLIVGTVCTIGTYLFLIYRQIWEAACKEGLRQKEEQTHFKHFSGTIITLIAGLPGIFLTLIPNIVPLRMSETGEIANSFSKVCYILMKFFFNGEYTGILQSLFPTLESMTTPERFASVESQLPFYLICLLPAIIAGSLAYAMGLKDRSVLRSLGIDVSKNKKDVPPYLK